MLITMTQSYLRKKGLFGKESNRNLEAGIETETMHECFLLAHFHSLLNFLSYVSQAHQARSESPLSGLPCLPPDIKKMSPRSAYRQV